MPGNGEEGPTRQGRTVRRGRGWVDARYGKDGRVTKGSTTSSRQQGGAHNDWSARSGGIQVDVTGPVGG